MSAQKWRRKPQAPSTDDILTVARYEPGKPLAGVIQVALMAPEGRCAVAYLPGRPEVATDGLTTSVLVAGWGTDAEYTVVPPGQYLVWDTRYDCLECYSEKELTAHYELEGEA